MARNRQRAKERQARRRAAGADGAPAPEARAEPEARPGPSAVPQPSERDNGRDEVRENVDLEVGAPPEDLGRSDAAAESEEAPEVEDDGDHFDPELDEPEDDPALESLPTGRRGGEAAEHKDRPRFVQFLFAVRAELARVQWPDRQALVTLTGVVLGFVLIAGGYLGLLDAIFSRVIQAIL